MAKEISFEVRDQTAIIYIDRPHVHNAIDDSTMSALEDALNRVEQSSDIRSLILTGVGKDAFCSGGDLAYFKTLKSLELTTQMSERMKAILERLSGGDCVAIAAVNGLALGGGCELMTACHFRIASSTATFAYRQAANGITTGWGGGFRLMNLLGRSASLRLLLTSETIDAAEAFRIGLVDRVAVPDDLLNTSLEFADKINRHDGKVISAFLRMSEYIHQGEIEKARSFESEIFATLFTSPEFRKFLERFSGK